jgi:retinol-binding protein 3
MRLRILSFTLAVTLALFAGPGRSANATPGSGPAPPDTPAGRCVAAYLEAYETADAARLEDFEHRYRARSAARERTIEDRVGRTRRIRDDLGRLDLRRVVSVGPAEIAVLVRSERTGMPWLLSFEFESQAPYRLVSVRAQPSLAAEDSDIYTAPLARDFVRESVRELGDLLRRDHVNAEVGRFLAEALAAHEARGDYDAVGSLADLAQRLTADLHAVSPDDRLGVVPLAGGAPPPDSATADPARGDQGFPKAEMLPGDVGHVTCDAFGAGDTARRAAADALARVADCRALILDLRDNRGGSPEMVEFLAGHLFDQPTHLESFYDRDGDRRLEIRTPESVPGHRFPASVPVYILTSGATEALAEGFTYDLKYLRRAVVVGERTAGSAHVVTDCVVHERLLVHLPYLREVNPVTGTNWEGVGVEPDIAVPAAQALAAAQADAAHRLRRSAGSRRHSATK